MIDILEMIQENDWVDPIGEDTEALLIAQAQQGSEWATLSLIRQYMPLIKKNVYASGGHNIEDAAQEMLITVMETINTHDPDKSPRLAGRLSTSLSGAVKAVGRSEQSQFSIPSGTLKRFNTILRAAEGDREKALTICKTHRMKPSTFLHIYNLVNNVSIIDEVTRFPSPGNDENLVCDSLLCDYALSVLEDEEAEIVRYAYGFVDLLVEGHYILPEGHNPLSASIVSAATGSSTHRVKTLHAKALKTMREALVEKEDVANVA